MTSSGPRTRFAHRLKDDESIAGAIAVATREHVLVATGCVLAAADVRLKHAGLVQVASRDQIRRIARVIGCDPEALASRGGERHRGGEGDGDKRTPDVSFGPLVMPSRFIELRTRRIAPASLAKSGHHRLAWLNLLLPYCPESLERMVDACPACATRLGWRIAVGLGVCENCGEVIPPSGDPDLPEALAADYRLMAALSSPDASIVRRTVSDLPSSLQGASPGTLVRLALQLGGLQRRPMVVAASRHLVVDLPAPVLAHVLAMGGSMLGGWPGSVAAWIDGTISELEGDPDAMDAFRNRLRRVTSRVAESDELIELVTAAIPHLLRRSAPRGPDLRRYLYRDVKRLLGLKPPQVAALHRWPELKVSVLPGRLRDHRLYDADQIDGLEATFRGNISLNACSNRSGLPVYAIEQLCFAGLLEWEDHPAVQLTRTWTCIRRHSADSLEGSLARAALREAPPGGTISLSRASARIGGREKPWAAILAALIERRLPCWRTGGRLGPTTLRVFPRDLQPFEMLVDEAAAPPGFERADSLSQLDLAELLNLPASYIAQSLDDELPSRRIGRALSTSKHEALCAARRLAFAPEIGLHIAVPSRRVAARLGELGLHPDGAGWSRAALKRAGILPGTPLQLRP